MRHGPALLAALCCSLIPYIVSAEDAPVSAEIQSAIKRCENIMTQVEEIRGLSFTGRVNMGVQSLKDFDVYLRDSITKSYGSEEEIKAYVRALVKLGVLDKEVDLVNMAADMMKSQAAAHYDPEKKKYFLLMTDMFAGVMDAISSHELCHALQDQHFSLNKLILQNVDKYRNNGDAGTAVQALVEGDATIVMTVWAMANSFSSKDYAKIFPVASVSLGAQASMDYRTICEMTSQAAREMQSGGESLAKAAESISSFPRWFVESLLLAYIQGAVMVDRVRLQGGWAAVDKLYENPPQSSEQLLHPEKLIGTRDLPQEISLPGLESALPKGWALTEQDVLGELGLRIMLDIWAEKGASDLRPGLSAEGWDGDRYYFCENTRTGKDLLVWKIVWDSPADAKEFHAAFQKMTSFRFPEAKRQDGNGKETRWTIEDKRTILLRPGRTSTIICDTTDPNILKDLINSKSLPDFLRE